jgi:hypothetical protein
MQLTRFDRWLLEEFVHETHIYTISEPVAVPRGVRSQPVPDTPGRRFNFHYIASNPRAAHALANVLKDHGQMFSSRVVNRRAWYVPIIAPAGKSITWRCVWIAFICVSSFFTVTYLGRLWRDETFQENFRDAIKTLRS